jgi:peroxiredoxin
VKIKILIAVALSTSCLFPAAFAQEKAASAKEFPSAIGLAIGTRAPAFSLRDQSGHIQTNDTVKGAKGTVLLFFRSADWCPFCKGQLMDLQKARARFEKQGLGLAAISYDTVEILKSFADRRGIEFPMLADPDSQVIRAYSVLNTEATGMNQGMSLPGYFFIDTSGIIRERFFEAKETYQVRYSANGVIAKLFPELAEQVSQNVTAPHIQLAMAQSDSAGAPGSLITVSAEIKLPAGVHVYAPGADGYIVTQLKIPPAPEYTIALSRSPKAKTLYLPAVKEAVPVYEGSFRLSQDVAVSYTPDFIASLGADGKKIEIAGQFRYQACDDHICYLPETIPMKWQVQVLPLDRQRAPEAIRHK